MDGFVKITLTQPYAPHGTNIPLLMRYGYTEARAVMIEDEYGRARSKAQPGKPIVYHLDFESSGKRSVIMPEAAARMNFGNWDIPEISESDDAPWQNTKFERDRLALHWGDYIRVIFDSDNKKNYALPAIAPPAVPHVIVSDVNEQGDDETQFRFDPWERYRWQEYCLPLSSLTEGMRLPPGYTNPQSAKAQTLQTQAGLISVTEGQLERMIAAAVASALADKKKSA